MHTLNDSRSLELMYEYRLCSTIFSCINKLYLTCSRDFHLACLINITIGMTCNSDRLLPVTNARSDTFYLNRCTENSSVKDCSDSAVRALPHFLQIILLYTSSIWCYGCTLNGNSVLLCRIRSILSNLIVSFVSMYKSEIVILCIQLDIRCEKFILYKLPEDTCHLVSIHLYKRGCHFNLFHFGASLCISYRPRSAYPSIPTTSQFTIYNFINRF